MTGVMVKGEPHLIFTTGASTTVLEEREKECVCEEEGRRRMILKKLRDGLAKKIGRNH